MWWDTINLFLWSNNCGVAHRLLRMSTLNNKNARKIQVLKLWGYIAWKIFLIKITSNEKVFENRKEKICTYMKNGWNNGLIPLLAD